MPNDDSTPQMFANSIGLSSVTAVSSHTASCRGEPQVHFVGADVSRQPDVIVDRAAVEQLQVSAWQAFEKAAPLQRLPRSAGRCATHSAAAASVRSITSSPYCSVRQL